MVPGQDFGLSQQPAREGLAATAERQPQDPWLRTLRPPESMQICLPIFALADLG